MESLYHEPVLLDESIAYLLANKDATLVRTYVDCTLGGGGYTKRLLELTPTEHKVVAIDRDVHAIEHCRTFLNNFEGRVIYTMQNFAEIASILKANMIDKVSGVVMDLGLSSYQLNEEDGFSYQRNTPLDMRADKQQVMTAADVLNSYEEADLNTLFKEYGELRYNRQIARDIVKAREEKKLQTTFDLVELLKEKIPPRYLNKDLSKVFQALRIEVNSELDNLKKVLHDAVEHLEQGARIAVISYHSLEDRIVKNFLRSEPGLKILTKHPVEAGDQEIERNTRARSAKLRAAEKK